MLEYLRNTSGCKINLVHAPAGYGKTTLLAHCRQSLRQEHRWLFVFTGFAGKNKEPTSGLEQLTPAHYEKESAGFGVLAVVSKPFR
jgi:ATP/maltotriose-dependent transcriptional regulator MalT